MNKLYIIFYLLNIIATQIYGAPAPTGNASTVYDVLTTNFSNTCPVLSSNVLVNSTTKYLSTCKDVSIINLSEEMSLLNMNKFYCMGMLTAELQLCSIISNNTYLNLPENFKELQEYIDEIQNMKPDKLCTLMKAVDLFNDTKIIPPSIQKSVFTLKKELTGSACSNLCLDFLADKKSNELCSMLYFIHIQINNASKVIAQQIFAAQDHKETKPNVTAVIAANSLNKVLSKQDTPSKQQENVEDKTSYKMVEQQPQVLNNVTSHKLSNQSPGDKVKNESKPENKSDAVPPIVNEAQPPEVAPVNQQSIPTELKDNKISANSTTEPLAAGKNEIPPQAVDKTKLEQPSVQSGEDKTVKTKSTGVVTNQNKIQPDKNEEPELPDETEYTTSIPENNVKPNSDNEDFVDDDEDDEEKELEETNVEAQKTREGDFISSSSNVNPMKDSLDVEDSNFFSYFMFISVMFIAGYVVYHNKQKIMALLLEGRRDRNSRRRPSTSSYRKLNSNLEEAVTSKCSGSASHVIY